MPTLLAFLCWLISCDEHSSLKLCVRDIYFRLTFVIVFESVAAMMLISSLEQAVWRALSRTEGPLFLLERACHTHLDGLYASCCLVPSIDVRSLFCSCPSPIWISFLEFLPEELHLFMVTSTEVESYSVSNVDASTFEYQVFSKFNLLPSSSHRSIASASEAASTSRSCPQSKSHHAHHQERTPG